ncbi:hypothetical protein P7C70_g6096, partial [Phenoliferia sp. Uapishka_3]
MSPANSQTIPMAPPSSYPVDTTVRMDGSYIQIPTDHLYRELSVPSSPTQPTDDGYSIVPNSQRLIPELVPVDATSPFMDHSTSKFPSLRFKSPPRFTNNDEDYLPSDYASPLTSNDLLSKRRNLSDSLFNLYPNNADLISKARDMTVKEIMCIF